MLPRRPLPPQVVLLSLHTARLAHMLAREAGRDRPGREELTDSTRGLAE